MSQHLRIVVADDEPEMLDYFREMLSALGHDVVGAAEDGEQLVEQCRTAQPDLIITDIRMPKMDGIEAAAVPKNLRRLSAIVPDITALPHDRILSHPLAQF